MKYIPIAVGAITSYLFGGWNDILGLLVMLMVVDYFSGTVAAAKEARDGTGPGLSSHTGGIGIAKKVLIIFFVAVMYRADLALGGLSLPVVGITFAPGTFPLRDGAGFFFCANEFLSLIENAGRLGITFPPWVRSIIAVLKGTQNKSNRGAKKRVSNPRPPATGEDSRDS